MLFADRKMGGVRVNSKERVYAALRHEAVDRLPRYIWVGRGAADNLRAALGERAADMDELVGNDVKQTWLIHFRIRKNPSGMRICRSFWIHTAKINLLAQMCLVLFLSRHTI